VKLRKSTTGAERQSTIRRQAKWHPRSKTSSGMHPRFPYYLWPAHDVRRDQGPADVYIAVVNLPKRVTVKRRKVRLENFGQ
jgi:hypothetical protein